MLDFHTHILPAIDDGSRDPAHSLAMLKAEAEQGITTIIATSHYYATEGSPSDFLARRKSAWEKLQPVLSDELPKVILGAEVQYFEGICSVDEIIDLRIGDSPLFLLEMPTIPWSQRMLDDILELNSRPGMQIVLAHIDRYLGLIPKNLPEQLVECGVMLQVNSTFFTHWQTSGRAKKLLKNGAIHFVGSDMHNLSSRAPMWNKLNPKLFAELEELTDSIAADFGLI